MYFRRGMEYQTPHRSIANKCYLGFVFGRGDAYENQFNVYLPAAIEL